MKKIYLLAGICGLFATVSAQHTDRNNMQALPITPTMDGKQVADATITDQAKAAGDTIWTEDFTGGIPAGWSVMDNTGNGFEWIVNNADITAQYTNTTAIASTSGGNHMLLFGDGYNTPGTPATFVNMDSYFQTSALNLGTLSGGTGYPGVSLKFEQKFRECCSGSASMNVLVSTDPAFGAASTMTFNTNNAGVAINNMSADPMVTTINISSIAGSNYTGDIYLRFHKTINSHYFWMVDDLELFETPSNDLVLLDANWSFGNTPIIPYTSIPTSQVSDITFNGSVLNNGGVGQPNTVFTTVVSGAGSATLTSTPATLALNANDTLVTDALTAAQQSALGVYNLNYLVGSDSTDWNPSDNSLASAWEFERTDFLYARDAGTYNGTYNQNDEDGDNIFDVSEMQIDYEIMATETAYALNVVFSDRTAVGQELYYNIYDGAGNALYDGLTNPIPQYTIQSGDLTSGAGSEVWVSLPLTHGLSVPGIELDASTGNIFTVAVGHEIDSLFIGVSGDALADAGNWTTAGIIYTPSSGAATVGYYLTDCPMIRIDFTPAATSVKEDIANVSLGQNIPNPAKATTSIPFSLLNGAEVSFVMTDMTGKIVQTRDLGTLSSGDHSIDLSTSDLAGGVYYYSVIVDGEKATKKLSVAK